MNFLFGSGNNANNNSIKPNPFDELINQVNNADPIKPQSVDTTVPANQSNLMQTQDYLIDKLTKVEYSKSNCIYLKNKYR